MSRVEVVEHVAEYPANLNDRLNAASDPLTPPELLWKISEDPKMVRYLMDNPALPRALFDELWEKVLQSSFPRTVDRAFANPLTTFDQIVAAVCRNYDIWPEELNMCREVIDVYDNLANFHRFRGGEKDASFMTFLLCSPLISSSELIVRLQRHCKYLYLNDILSSSQFDLSHKEFYNLYSSDLNIALSLALNQNASPELLVQILDLLRNIGWDANRVFENLNCPIELSAPYHMEHVDEYMWKPSYMKRLDQTASEYLSLLSGGDVWADLPLSWKLKMIAE